MKNWQDDRNYRKIRQPDGTMKNLIFVDGQAVEVTDEVFAAYSQMDRQERYQEELLQDNPHVSLEKLADACVPIEEYMLEQAIQQRDLEQRAAECENARLKEIMQRIRETPCALTEYDDLLVRQIVERVTVDSKEQITVIFGQGVDIQVQIP